MSKMVDKTGGEFHHLFCITVKKSTLKAIVDM